MLSNWYVSAKDKKKDKEFNKISKCKDIEKEPPAKKWYLKTTTEPAIVGTLGMTKKIMDKHIYKIPNRPSLYGIKKKNTLENCSPP